MQPNPAASADQKSKKLFPEILPAWNNTTEYQALQSPDFKQDWDQAKSLIEELKKINLELDSHQATSEKTGKPAKTASLLQRIAEKRELAMILIANLSTYTQCEESLDAKNQQAQKTSSQIKELYAEFLTALVPSNLILKTCDDSLLAEYLRAPHTKGSTFYWQHERKMRPFVLSSEEEKTLAQFSPFASGAWGDLYSQISGSLKVKLASGEVGLAEAAGILRGPDEAKRKEAWLAIQAAWKSVEIPSAAVLNNLVGYRLAIYKKRSHTEKMHFLQAPLHGGRITEKTLNAMMQTVQDQIQVPRRALRAMAKSLNKSKLDPWDILAPSPRMAADAKFSYAEGLAMVQEAFASVDPKMGAFVETMSKNNWIEARILPNKGAGAHCTGFLKSKTPRVFQSYLGSFKDISTLAHELGHAYHSWVMRDLSILESNYPMTVAETASTFSETMLAEQLFEKANSEQKFSLAWEDASAAAIMLLNIPARFDFEKSLYEAREKGTLSPQELSDLTDQAWRKWYGDELSQTESQYWMTKMHFSFAGISFYNFPYTFGYLFSLGIYATREKLGAGFHQAYVDLLRDSGRMTVEDLVQKHLQADITKPQFWLDSIKIIEKNLKAFEDLI